MVPQTPPRWDPARKYVSQQDYVSGQEHLGPADAGRPTGPAEWQARGRPRWCRRTAAESIWPGSGRHPAAPGRGSRRRRSPRPGRRRRSTAGARPGLVRSDQRGRRDRCVDRRRPWSLSARRSGTRQGEHGDTHHREGAGEDEDRVEAAEPDREGREHRERQQRSDQRAGRVHRPVHTEIPAEELLARRRWR